LYTNIADRLGMLCPVGIGVRIDFSLRLMPRGSLENNSITTGKSLSAGSVNL